MLFHPLYILLYFIETFSNDYGYFWLLGKMVPIMESQSQVMILTPFVEFDWLYMKKYLHFLTFLDIEMTWWVEILPHKCGKTLRHKIAINMVAYSLPNKGPGHPHPWNCPSSDGIFQLQHPHVFVMNKNKSWYEGYISWKKLWVCPCMMNLIKHAHSDLINDRIWAQFNSLWLVVPYGNLDLSQHWLR